MVDRRWVVPVLALTLSACDSHGDELSIASPPGAQQGSWPLAVGAFYQLAIVDNCYGGWDIGCDAGTAISIDEVVVEKEQVLRALPLSALPPEYQAPPPYVLGLVEGLSPGKTKVTIRATFDDGSSRRGDAEFAVERADRMTAAVRCFSGSTADEPVPLGQRVELGATFYHGDQQLAGLVPNALIGQDVLPLVGTVQGTGYVFDAPNEAGTVTIGSGVFPGYSLDVRMFAPEEVVVGETLGKVPNPIRRNSRASVRPRLSVDGQELCYDPMLQITSRTPDICIGINGLADWLGDRVGEVPFVALESGPCLLSVGVAGVESRWDLELELVVRNE